MNRHIKDGTALVLAGLLVPAAVAQQAPAANDTSKIHPTAVCNDGSFDHAELRENACKDKKGLREWWGKVVPPSQVPVDKDTADSRGQPKPAAPAATKP